MKQLLRFIANKISFNVCSSTDSASRVLHEWYYGCYVKPVYGRYERHCLWCTTKEYKDYSTKDKNKMWVKF